MYLTWQYIYTRHNASTAHIVITTTQEALSTKRSQGLSCFRLSKQKCILLPCNSVVGLNVISAFRMKLSRGCLPVEFIIKMPELVANKLWRRSIVSLLLQYHNWQRLWWDSSLRDPRVEKAYLLIFMSFQNFMTFFLLGNLYWHTSVNPLSVWHTHTRAHNIEFSFALKREKKHKIMPKGLLCRVSL